MPRKPKKPCSCPGCAGLTYSKFCEVHQHLEVPAERTKIDYRYKGSWKKIRKLYFESHPFCEECRKNGKATPGEEVHHKLPLSQGGTHEFSNLMTLCKRCHSKETYRSGDRWKVREYSY